jgi:DNA primase
MGTALTDEQVDVFRRTAPTVYLALDADRAGQDAMLRAGHAAKKRNVDLLVVGLPEGRDPADLLAADGPGAIERVLDAALSVPEFEVRREIAAADLSTPRGRDRALSQVRPIIATVPRNTATRDELVRFVADRLDIDRNYLMTQDSAPVLPAEPHVDQSQRRSATLAPLDAVARSERTFLSMCIASELGHEYVERLRPDHFSFEPLRRVRAHLLEHWHDPLAGLPDEDPALSALIKDVVLRADDEDVSADVLRLTFLQLEFRRVERGLRHAEQDRDFDAQRALATERQGLRDQIDELMGLTL